MRWAVPEAEYMDPGTLGCQGCGGALSMRQVLQQVGDDGRGVVDHVRRPREDLTVQPLQNERPVGRVDPPGDVDVPGAQRRCRGLGIDAEPAQDARGHVIRQHEALRGPLWGPCERPLPDRMVPAAGHVVL